MREVYSGISNYPNLFVDGSCRKVSLFKMLMIDCLSPDMPVPEIVLFIGDYKDYLAFFICVQFGQRLMGLFVLFCGNLGEIVYRDKLSVD